MTDTSDEISDIEEDKYNDNKDNDGNSIPGLQEREVENNSDEEYNEEGVDDDAHSINNGMRSKNANTAVPRPRGGTEVAYRIEGTRSGVEDEEVDLYCQGSDDNKSTNDVFARTSEEHDDTNEEAAPSTSFEESHTATVQRQQQTRSFVLDDLDEDESSPMGGSMENDKMEGNIRISTWNPNGINANQVQSILQQSLDLSIDIQGYSEVNRDFLKQHQRQAFQEATTRMDRNSKAIWGTSQVIVEGNYKPGGTVLLTFGKTAGQVKECGSDPLGRWTYQILDGKGNKEVLIMNVYQCCRSPTNPTGITSYHQQTIMLSEMDKTDTNPRRNFRRDLIAFIKSKVNKANTNVIPIIMGD
jgi:hypothetical protein